ncbi:MAG TPA: beta-glucosidase, partial [Hyphomicrobiales bacterium]
MRKQAGQPPKRPNTYSLLPADEVLLDLVQHQTFTYFWDAAHQPSGMAFDRISAMRTIENVPIATGGTGAGVMAMIVAAERRWVRRGEAVERLSRILTYLETAVNYYGAFPHFFDVVTGQEF